MYTRRRDNKNRILHKGESQLADGRYRFKYRDYDGMTRYVYSWRLDKRDRAPAGKKDDDCLREKEQEILDNLHDQIVNKGGNMTVLQLVKKYISTKTGVRNSTQAGYQTVVNFLKNDPLGAKRIDQVKRSDAKCWMIQLQKEQHKSYSSIHSIRGVIRPAFRMALDDDLPKYFCTKVPKSFEAKLLLQLLNGFSQQDSRPVDIDLHQNARFRAVYR
jgi:hypothetical protein